MVNLHFFNFKKVLESSQREQLCFNATLSHQTNCKVFIWTEENEEIKEIINNSAFCQKVISTNDMIFYVYDYVKCEIGRRYGGWLIELDQEVLTDLSSVETGNYSYFHTINDTTMCAATWLPIYFNKGEDISSILNFYDTVGITMDYPCEFTTCQIRKRDSIKDIGELDVSSCHFVTALFTFGYYPNDTVGKEWIYRTFEYIDGGFINCTYKNEDGVEIKRWYTADLFFKVAEIFGLFSSVIPKLISIGGKVEMDIDTFNEIKKHTSISFPVSILTRLHVFNFNSQLNSERAKLCLSETLKNQSNYKLYTWTENLPEIQKIIKNSKYCQAVLSMQDIYWPAIYDYVKLHIMKSYGGWFFELDHVILDDLSKVQIEEGHSYLTKGADAPNLLATTWIPLYASKGIDLSELIYAADEKYSNPLSISEADYCRIPLGHEPHGAESFKAIKFYHFETGAFKYLKAEPSGKQKLIYEQNNEICMYCNDFLKFTKKFYTFDFFNKICKLFNFFEKQVSLFIENGGEIIISKDLYEKLLCEYSTLDNRVKVIPNESISGDLSRFFS